MDCKVVICILAAIFLSSEGYISNEEPQKRSKPRRLGKAQKRFLSGLTAYTRFQDVVLRPMIRVRVPGTQGHHLVKTFIEDEFTKLNWNVTTDEFDGNTPIGMKRFTNIIATLNPNAKKKLIIAAHYDSKLYEGQNKFFVGAIDSAVPCAMMIELAKTINPLLAEFKNNNDRTLQMVFFDGEEAFKTWNDEDSIYGSRHLAAKWENESKLQDIEALILLDLIGSPRPSFYPMSDDTFYLFERLAKIEREMGPTNYFRADYDARGIRIEDDHIPFLQKKVPILHIIPVPFPDVWHKFEDDEDHLDNDVIHDLIKIFREFIIEEFGVRVPFDNEQERP